MTQGRLLSVCQECSCFSRDVHEHFVGTHTVTCICKLTSLWFYERYYDGQLIPLGCVRALEYETVRRLREL